jgi:anti-anti-sigma factor
MTPIESLPPTVSRRGETTAGRPADRLVVWVRGEHDISTAAALSETLTGVVAGDGGDLVVDLSGVPFMDASTVGVIVRVCGHLRRRSRSLAVRSPSTSARRILDLCGLADLIDPDSDPELAPGGALGSWVAVPVADRVDQPADATVPAPTLMLACSVPAASPPRRP